MICAAIQNMPYNTEFVLKIRQYGVVK